MKNKRLAISLTLIAATLFGLGLGARINKIKANKVINVPVASGRYSDGDVLESRDFHPCSAVILDYEDKAVMTHAPYNAGEYLGSNPDNVYVENNVVKYLSNKMQEKGIDPKKCKAFINAGSGRSLERIINDLKEAGIEIESSKLNKTCRNIRYNPKTNEMCEFIIPYVYTRVPRNLPE